MKKQNQLWQSARKVLAIAAILLIALPASAQTTQTHIVKRGETFSSIASKYGITESELRTANPNVKNCYAGTKLNIVKKAPVQIIAKPSTAAPSSGDGGGAVKLMLISAKYNIDKGNYKKATKKIDFVLSSAQSTEQQKEEARQLLAVVEKAKEERRERRAEALDNLSNSLQQTANTLMALGMAASQMEAIQRGAYVPPMVPVPIYNNPAPWYGSNTTQQILINQQRQNNEVARKATENMNRIASGNYGASTSGGASKFNQFYRLAQQGNAQAQYGLGMCYENGVWVAQNKAEAAKWYKMASQQGYADAQYHLGRLYSKGDGVAKNDVEAVKWYKLAAQQGNADAQFSLGECYWSGSGVIENNQIAMEWLKKSKCGRLQSEELEKLRDQLIVIIQNELNGSK